MGTEFVKVGAMQLTSCRGRAVTRVSRRSRSKQRTREEPTWKGSALLDGDEIRGSEGGGSSSQDQDKKLLRSWKKSQLRRNGRKERQHIKRRVELRWTITRSSLSVRTSVTQSET